jgi:hypothetical protein
VDEAKQIELFRTAGQSAIVALRSGTIRPLAWRARQSQPLRAAYAALLLGLVEKASDVEGLALLELIEGCSDVNLPVGIQILEKLPIGRLASVRLESALQALIPFHQRTTAIPDAVVRSVVMQLVEVPELDMSHFPREWEALIDQYPRLVFDLLIARLERANSGDRPTGYVPVPFTIDGRLDLPAMTKEPDYLDRFEGSLVIFRFPDLTRALLRKAKTLGGQEVVDRIQWSLYAGCGPQARSYSNGALDKEMDYVEAEAVKAAEIHATDELLGPFYRWIVEIEQQQRLMHKRRVEMEDDASE